VPDNDASFDATGTWTGTATDTFAEPDAVYDVTLVLDNNGGRDGLQLAGKLSLEGIGTLPFTDSYIAPLPGAQRISDITIADSQGYSYTLGATFTDKRVDDGTLRTTNPAFTITGVGRAILDVRLIKQ
jgi:hypothetical protein